MLLIPCPWCGHREQNEFTFGGEVENLRPKRPEEVSDERWAEYLYGAQNIAGGGRHFVCHTSGCGQWFSVSFDTVSHCVVDALPMGETVESAP